MPLIQRFVVCYLFHSERVRTSERMAGERRLNLILKFYWFNILILAGFQTLRWIKNNKNNVYDKLSLGFLILDAPAPLVSPSSHGHCSGQLWEWGDTGDTPHVEACSLTLPLFLAQPGLALTRALSNELSPKKAFMSYKPRLWYFVILHVEILKYEMFYSCEYLKDAVWTPNVSKWQG